MRMIKELLIILRDYIIKYGVKYGMCSIIANELYPCDIISGEEREDLFQFLDNNAPEGLDTQKYWWPTGWDEPRIKWLNEQIKKL